MLAEADRLVETYLAWLKDTTTLRTVDDWIEITTPYLDRHNDYLQIYVKRQNDNYTLPMTGISSAISNGPAATSILPSGTLS